MSSLFNEPLTLWVPPGKSHGEMDQAARFLTSILASTGVIKRYMIPMPDGVTPYLERFVLEENEDGSKVYLHIIWGADGDRDPHDHPFDFESTIIWGGYDEHTYARSCPTGSKEHAYYSTKEDLTHCPCGEPLIADCYRMTSTYKAGDKNVRKAHELHRIVRLTQTPTITLVRRGPKVRSWGFQTEKGWVHHRPYIAEKFPNAQPTEVD